MRPSRYCRRPLADGDAITASVAPMRRPAISAGIDAGTSIFQKICSRLML
jgi:hypothetical protein